MPRKNLVEGENADPDYFGRDTGDASKDDPLNQDEIGENETSCCKLSVHPSMTAVQMISSGIEDALAGCIIQTGQ